MTRRWSRPHYASLDDAGAEQHPVDTAVEARLPLLDERRRLNELGSRLLDALGEDRHLYLAFEAQRNAVAAAREAAYFDLGVEHGAAVASAGVLGDEGALTLARRLLVQVINAPIPPQSKLNALLECVIAIARSLPSSLDQENA